MKYTKKQQRVNCNTVIYLRLERGGISNINKIALDV